VDRRTHLLLRHRLAAEMQYPSSGARLHVAWRHGHGALR
jgi:hypothetical protein